MRPPTVRRVTFISYTRRIYILVSVQFIRFSLLLQTHPTLNALLRFVFLSPELCPSRFLLIPPRGGHPKQKEYEAAITKIFTDSGKTYGPDRVCGLLRRQGYTASYRRVSNIMKRLGLSSIHNRRRQRSLTNSRDARGKEWPNLIRDLEVFKPFQVVTSDISYIRNF